MASELARLIYKKLQIEVGGVRRIELIAEIVVREALGGDMDSIRICMTAVDQIDPVLDSVDDGDE